MDIETIRKEREKWLTWKNIAPLREMLRRLPNVTCKVELGDVIRISSAEGVDREEIERTARAMMPWRKGPFALFGVFIDSEWQSFMKYNLIRKYFHLTDKVVADVGCNNGYYMFRMLEDKPKKLVGFDPSPLFMTQFAFIDRFIKSGITYGLLGVEHLPLYEHKFDFIFCLGVLYHRSDPVAMLKALYKGLEKGGEVLLDTFMIDGEAEVALTPKERYSKIPNIYFVPTIPALRNWVNRAGFSGFEVLEIVTTDTNEQRKTEWIEGQSLENFLDLDDSSKTVEGYPAPKRVYVKLRKD